MVEHIFAENSKMRDTGLFNYPKLLLRLNEDFKDMGFKRVEYNSEIDKTTFKRDLTLIFIPRLSGWGNTYQSELRYGTSEEQQFYEIVKQKVGYTRSISFTRLKTSDTEPREQIKIKFEARGEQKSIVIGDYLYERNIVLFYPSILRSDLSLLNDNVYLFFFINFLKKWVKDNKVKKVSVRAKIQEMMLKQFRQNSADKINTYKNEISNNNNTIKDYNENIVRMIKDTQEKKVIIEGLDKLVKITMRDLTKEISKIKKLPFVKSVRLTSSGVNVEVKDVKINFKNQEVKMGDYIISILPNNFKINAKTPVEREGQEPLHHPHIDSSGGICFGNRKDKINMLLAEMKFSKLVYFLYLYLQSYNDGDRYNPISWWIDGSDDGS